MKDLLHDSREQVLGGREDVFVVQDLAPVEASVFDCLGGAAEVPHVDRPETPPGAFALVTAVAGGVQDDADVASGHVVGAREERSVLGFAKGIECLEDRNRGGREGERRQRD